MAVGFLIFEDLLQSYTDHKHKPVQCDSEVVRFQAKGHQQSYAHSVIASPSKIQNKQLCMREITIKFFSLLLTTLHFINYVIYLFAALTVLLRIRLTHINNRTLFDYYVF